MIPDKMKLSMEMHPLLTYDVVDKLKEKQIFTIDQFLQQDLDVLCKITKLKFKSLLIIRKHILNKNSAVIRNGLEYYNEILQKTAIISTNHENLDAILNGGFYTGTIYELCTKSAQHSTRFIYKFMLDFLEKHQNSSNNQCLMYFDTKFSFNPLWMQFICDTQFGMNKLDAILENLLLAQVKDIYELVEGLNELKEQLDSKEYKLRVVIIDSLTATLYSTVRIEKHNMLLNKLIDICRLLAVEYHVCVIFTSLLTQSKENLQKTESLETQIEGYKVYGGKYWQTLPNVRLKLSKIEEISLGNAENARKIDENEFNVSIIKNNMGTCENKCRICLV